MPTHGQDEGAGGKPLQHKARQLVFDGSREEGEVTGQVSVEEQTEGEGQQDPLLLQLLLLQLHKHEGCLQVLYHQKAFPLRSAGR